MTILEALKESGVRVSVGNRWLVLSDTVAFAEFVVYKRKPYAKRMRNRLPREIYRGVNESEAVEALLK